MPRPVHFEIPADDAKRATKFFSDVFGWQFQEWENSGYHLATTGAEGEMGINGAIMQRHAPGQTVANAIDVPSIDDYAAKIQAAGGQIIVPKMAVGEMGWTAYFTDTEGNVHGLWETKKNG